MAFMTQHIYVNADTGSDTTGDGTAHSPYETPQRAVEDIPSAPLQLYVVHLSAPTTGVVGGAGLELDYDCARGGVVFVGEDRTVLSAGAVDSAPTDRTTIKDASQSWVPDEHAGKTCLFTSGPAKGQYRTILANTADELIVGYYYPDPPQLGDTYEVFESATQVDMAGVERLGSDVGSSRDFPFPFSSLPASVPREDGTVGYVNICFSGVRKIGGSEAAVVGCEFLDESLTLEAYVSAGMRSFPVLEAPEDPSSHFLGWGGYFSLSGAAIQPLNGYTFMGVVVEGRALSSSLYSGSGFYYLPSVRLMGGPSAADAPLNIGSGAVVRAGIVATTGYGRVIIRPRAGVSPASTFGWVTVHPGGSLEMGGAVEISTGDGDMDALSVLGGSVRYIAPTGSTEPKIHTAAGSKAVRVRGNGQFLFDKVDLSDVRVAGSNTEAVSVGPVGAETAHDTGGTSAFAGNGGYAKGVDGSLVLRND